MRYKTHDGDQPSKLETRMGTGAMPGGVSLLGAGAIKKAGKKKME